ncbi:MAG: hypothetical protein AAF570_00120 [Bacteroidota bacterium]
MLVLAVLGIWRFGKKEAVKSLRLYSDAEVVDTRDDGKKLFKGENGLFYEGQTQDNQFARSGSFSSKVHKGQAKGIGTTYGNMPPNETWEVRVWRKTEGDSKNTEAGLVVWTVWGDVDTLRTAHSTDAQGWDELYIRFQVPEHWEDAGMEIYTWNDSESPAWFDDFEVIRHFTKDPPPYPNYSADSLPILALHVNDKDLDKIRRIRQRALDKGLLVVEDDDWVKARLEARSPDEPGATAFKGKIRLKGDWLDHLKSGKWSYRVSLAPGHSWRGMVTFSVQNPITRHLLSEYVFHQWLEREDVLTTRYDFIQLRFNGQSKGLYAYEEHFLKQLVESRSRREGPLMRFAEDGFWEPYARQSDRHRYDKIIGDALAPLRLGAAPSAFRLGPSLKNPVLKKQFLSAQDHLSAYRNNEGPVGDYFDLEKMARYCAVLDLLTAYHNFDWINQRYYFNPVTLRLEPIGYDGFSKLGGRELFTGAQTFMGAASLALQDDPEKQVLGAVLFRDREFMGRYLQALARMSDQEYLDGLFGGLDTALVAREQLIRREFPRYRYKRWDVYARAKLIRKMATNGVKEKVSAWPARRGGETGYLVENGHVLPVEVVALRGNAGEYGVEEGPWIWPKNVVAAPEAVFVPGEVGMTQVRVKVPGFDVAVEVSVAEVAREVAEVPERLSCAVCEVEGQEIFVGPGVVEVTEKTVIPAGYVLRVQPGTELRLGAEWICGGPVMLRGSADAPIVVSGNGALKVHGTRQESQLRHVVVRVKGGVEFSEAPVRVWESGFEGAALKVVRSRAKLEWVRFSGEAVGLRLESAWCKAVGLRFAHGEGAAIEVKSGELKLVDKPKCASGQVVVDARESGKVYVGDKRFYPQAGASKKGLILLSKSN